MGAPSFLVIGAQKAGTTSLYGWLQHHPAVSLSQTKEVHFFDQHFHRGVDWYSSQFSGPCSGEATPYYLFHPLAPQRAATVVPEARLIVLLREPVSRAWSHYHHVRRQGSEPLSFVDAIALEQLRLRGEVDKMLEDGRYTSLNHQKYSYLSRGLYADQLERWLRFFPREQLLVLETGALHRQPQASLDAVCDFLGVPPVTLSSFPRYNTGGGYPPLDPALAAELRGMYAPHNARLIDLLGEQAPAFAWRAAAA
jgi:hypothetical protein